MATYNKRGYKAPKPKDENETVDNISEQDSATAEVFNTLDSGANKIEDWIQNNQKLIFAALGGLTLIVIGFFAYQKFVIEPKEEKAVNEIYQAQKHFEQATNGIASDSLYNLALNGAEGKMGFLKIMEHYSGTKTANIAHYYAGISYLNLHKYKEAISELEKFKSDDELLNPLATGAIGDAFAQNNQIEEALGYYEKAFAARTNDLTTPRFLFKAGQVALALNQKDKAFKYFSRIQNEFGSAPEAQNIEGYIGMAQ